MKQIYYETLNPEKPKLPIYGVFNSSCGEEFGNIEINFDAFDESDRYQTRHLHYHPLSSLRLIAQCDKDNKCGFYGWDFKTINGLNLREIERVRPYMLKANRAIQKWERENGSIKSLGLWVKIALESIGVKALLIKHTKHSKYKTYTKSIMIEAIDFETNILLDKLQGKDRARA